MFLWTINEASLHSEA